MVAEATRVKKRLAFTSDMNKCGCTLPEFHRKIPTENTFPVGDPRFASFLAVASNIASLLTSIEKALEDPDVGAGGGDGNQLQTVRPFVHVDVRVTQIQRANIIKHVLRAGVLYDGRFSWFPCFLIVSMLSGLLPLRSSPRGPVRSALSPHITQTAVWPQRGEGRPDTGPD